MLRSRAPSSRQQATDSEPREVECAERHLYQVAQAAAAGDADAAETLVTRIGGSLLGTVRKVLGANHPDLEEVAQAAAVAVLRALPQFCGGSSVTQFARRVALLTALGAHRRLPPRTRTTGSVEAGVNDLPSPADVASYLETLSQRRRELARHLFAELSEPMAEALALHTVLGLSVEEIASSQGLSPSTVWSRLRVGKRALERTLDQRAELSMRWGLGGEALGATENADADGWGWSQGWPCGSPPGVRHGR